MPFYPGSAIADASDPAPVSLPVAWSDTQESAANTAQTLTRVAEAGSQHFITLVEVTIKGARASGDIDVVLQDGAVPIWSEVIGDGAKRGARVGGTLASALEISTNTAANLVIDAGGAGVVTVATLAGYTL